MLISSLASALVAGNITVTKTTDDGPGTLRQAIASASDGQSIDFNLPAPAAIVLKSGEIAINKKISITGPGAAKLKIDASGSGRIFHITGTATVTISGVSIQNGRVKDENGGGILIDSDATLNLKECVVSGNYAGKDGGGIDNDGDLVVSGSTFSNNTGTLGGGIFNSGGLKVLNSTFYNNSAGYGGAIANHNFGSATIISATISGNQASEFEGGGGIVNSAAASARSFYTLTIGSTILANNKGNDCLITISANLSLGYNLTSDTSCYFFVHPGDKKSTDAKLEGSAPKDNGGTTPTIAFSKSSPALDAMPADECIDENDEPITLDQRGIHRPQGAKCDIGAIELEQN